MMYYRILLVQGEDEIVQIYPTMDDILALISILMKGCKSLTFQIDKVEVEDDF